MSGPQMRRRCPTAVALGPARLEGWRFIITTDGYAGLVRAPGTRVFGVLWRLKPRDLAALDAYENVDGGLYRRATIPVHHEGRHLSALVYLPRTTAEGRPRPGYLELVLAAAREWHLPSRYVAELARWVPSRLSSARRPDAAEIR